MKIKLSELKQNPFKKYIRDGELDEERLEILQESIDHGTLPEHFFARKNDGVFELTSGHHRLEALIRAKGGDYVVDVTPVSFSDEQMLVDMVRENITQRDSDFRDTNESILLARSWLQSKALTVNQFNSELKKHTGGNHSKGVWGTESLPDSFRSIATFLSKNGKTISYVTVKNHLDMHDKLMPEIYEQIRKKKHQGTEKDGVGVKDALILTEVPKEEQKIILEQMEKTRDRSWEDTRKNVKLYLKADETIKQKVKKGELDLADVENASTEKEIKDFNKDNPRSEFIPNFAGRLKQFDKDVYILEKQVRAFSMVFHDDRFKDRYATLKPKQKDSLHDLIFNITSRVKKCYEEVEYFREVLGMPLREDGTVLKLVGKKEGKK